jgi:hypothetical protein
MYRIRTKGYSKKDPQMRWALPDRVFFACGACHVLAAAFLERYAMPEAKALWLKPNAGQPSNHIVVATGDWVFDYHGYASRAAYFAHVARTSRRHWPDWELQLVELPAAVLVSESASRVYDGLWLREPGQFLHDAMARARAYLDRFPEPPSPIADGRRPA